MKHALLTFFLIFAALPAYAQPAPPTVQEGKEGKVIAKPLCTYLTNRSDQSILGTIGLASQTLPDGETIIHSENFRLKAGDKRQVCAAGPFYEGRRIKIILRTVMPLFECKTKMDHEIFLDATPQPGSYRKLSATCS